MEVNRIIEKSQKPLIFEKGSSQMWVDEYISQQMLEAHLDPNTDAASRNPNTMDASVKWIENYICGNNHELKILDLGCGPGLYTNRLAGRGFKKVMGVDFSTRSIQYAKNQASECNLQVDYIFHDYITLDFTDHFDLVLLIYCDLGVLDEKERDTLLHKIYNHLYIGGKFVFDVFTPKRYKNHIDSRTWNSFKSGFWRPTAHICLNSNYWYSEERVHLQQTIVLEDNKEMQIYNIWDKTYSIEDISALLSDIGFEDFEFYSDITGREYEEESETLTVIAHKR